ncbi:hypothetical protein [Thiomicrorhabdus xiamenensis]|uniref:Uncharacterized protein n=1 Tax=Thiomicrorhabdus xiamenensis TaxID=2739063 RepID=A0A7D4TF88_9GAMM|nr:hypothetical protein [Thiomicrorhabdus xiamenensis]QKI89967.1 hypothetical protein HQN79_10490 [Thiomicrorhabdus xiamenensis]
MKSIIFLGLLVFNTEAFSVLSPSIQADKDRHAMDEYIRDHRALHGHIEHIDYENFVIYLDSGCRLVFEREEQVHPSNWVGPAGILIMNRKECEELK